MTEMSDKEKFVDWALARLDGTDMPVVMLGPVGRDEDGNWCFAICLSDNEGEDGFRVLTVDACAQQFDAEEVEAERTKLLGALALASRSRKQTVIVHDFGDDLTMARWAEGAWPGERSRGIREVIEAALER